jgi:hypothetical protein
MADGAAPRNAIATVLRDVSVPMRDGTRLATDVYFPDTAATAKATILIRTPYGKTDPTEQAEPLARYLAAQGFAVAVQDLRGTGRSEGQFKAYSRIEGPDGSDTLDWLVAQRWCAGRIGTVGCSYHGEVQDMLAAQRHPNHAAAFIEGAYTYNDGGMRAFSFVRHGVVELAYAVGGDLDLLSTLPLADIRGRLAHSEHVSYYARRWPEMVHAWLTKAPTDAYWNDDGGLDERAAFDVPAIHMNEWYSVPFSSIRMFDQYRSSARSPRAREHQYLVMSPMTHCRTSSATEHTVVGERDLGDARFDYFGTMVRWFDHWLNGTDNGITRLPKVQAYSMGRNAWRSYETWPPAGVVSTSYFLTSARGANTRHGDGLLMTHAARLRDGSDSFTYDPADPVPSCGGPVCGGRVFSPGAFDQRTVEERRDVLVYSTPPLALGVDVSGRVEVVLYVTSSACDTDFTAKLVDVYPDGRAYNVLEGITRMRFRAGLDGATLLEPGKIYEARIDLDSTSNYFAPAHRIRLEVSSSNFPRFDRNLNTGLSGATEHCFMPARNIVLHGCAHPSRLILPVVEAGTP